MTDEKIIGLYKVDAWIREELLKPENSHVCGIEKLGLNYGFVQLLPFSHSKTLFGDLFSEFVPASYFEDDFPLTIDATTLKLLVNLFVKEQSKDQEFTEIATYYQRMAEKCENYDFFDRKEEIYPSPNALAVLLYGIIEFDTGLNEKQKTEFDFAIKDTMITSGKSYVWPTYNESLSYINSLQKPQQHYINNIEITIPAKKAVPDNIMGIDKIEEAIFQRLKATGNRGFISSADLSTLELDVSRVPEAGHSEQPLVPINQSPPRQWVVSKPVLEALTDRFAQQLQSDRKAHGDVFAVKIHSPSAQALLMHGVKYATRDILGKAPEIEIVRQLVLGEIIADEARNYAKCVIFKFTPEEVRRENGKALRPTYQPDLSNWRPTGSNL